MSKKNHQPQMNENIRFAIDQIRKDQIITVLEASAISLLCIVLYFFVSRYFHRHVRYETNFILVLLASGYTMYAIIGNIFRTKRIKELIIEMQVNRN